jgi:hypothetical protein
VASLPTGTFLFTDIEGSTKMWESHPRAMHGAYVSSKTPSPRGCDSAPYWPMAVIQECNFMEPEV